MSTPRGWKSKWNANKPKRVRVSQRRKALSATITPDRIATFTAHLMAVSFGPDSECWLYLGCSRDTTLPVDVAFRPDRYAYTKFNGITVGAHQFALAASEGITLAELQGFDVHHTSTFGACMGYRCCNPDHLKKLDKREHALHREDISQFVRVRHTSMVLSIIQAPATERRPVEYRGITGAGTRHRFLAGVPFLIRGGDVAGADGAEGPEFKVTKSVTDVHLAQYRRTFER